MLPFTNGVPVLAERYEYGRLYLVPKTDPQSIAPSHAWVVRLYGVRKFISARFGGKFDGTVDAKIQLQIQQAVYDAQGYSMRIR
jgi:hypothetical protein